MVVLFGVADLLEANCTGKARDAIAAVLALKPETAVLADNGACRTAGPFPSLFCAHDICCWAVLPAHHWACRGTPAMPRVIRSRQ